jgi:hypothetical protein
MEDLYNKMLDARSGIEKVVERMPRDVGNEEFRSVASRMLEVEEAVTKGHDVIQEILADSNRLLQELMMNRVPETHVKNKDQICNRLDDELRVLFPRSEESQTALRKVLEERRPPDPLLVEIARQAQDQLLAHLKYTLDLMGSLEAQGKLIRKGQEILDRQLAVKEMLQSLLVDEQDMILDAVAGKANLTADPIVMLKGEKKVVTVNLGRDQLDGRLVVAVAPPQGSGLTAPSSVKAARMGAQVQFEIEATKAGEFTVAIVPRNKNLEAVPTYNKEPPFKLKVTVK